MTPYHMTLRPNEQYPVPDKLVECPDCGGEGAIMMGIIIWKCETCNGTGTVKEDFLRTIKYRKP